MEVYRGFIIPTTMDEAVVSHLNWVSESLSLRSTDYSQLIKVPISINNGKYNGTIDEIRESCRSAIDKYLKINNMEVYK